MALIFLVIVIISSFKFQQVKLL